MMEIQCSSFLNFFIMDFKICTRRKIKQMKEDQIPKYSKNMSWILQLYVCNRMELETGTFPKVYFIFPLLLQKSCESDASQRKEGVKKRCHWESKMKNSAKEEEVLVLVWFCCPFFHQKLFSLLTTGPKLILQGIIISLVF